jgi:hypothetical protein
MVHQLLHMHCGHGGSIRASIRASIAYQEEFYGVFGVFLGLGARCESPIETVQVWRQTQVVGHAAHNF